MFIKWSFEQISKLRLSIFLLYLASQFDLNLKHYYEHDLQWPTIRNNSRANPIVTYMHGVGGAHDQATYLVRHERKGRGDEIMQTKRTREGGGRKEGMDEGWEIGMF